MLLFRKGKKIHKVVYGQLLLILANLINISYFVLRPCKDHHIS